jgi:hypothetical protein
VGKIDHVSGEDGYNPEYLELVWRTPKQPEIKIEKIIFRG